MDSRRRLVLDGLSGTAANWTLRTAGGALRGSGGLQTATLLDRRRFALMKPGAAFVNIGRSGSADYVALADALKSGAISGAVIDVYDQEPLPANSPLWGIGNLIMMPHVTSDDEDQYLRKTFDMVFENVRRIAAGKPLLNVIDRNRGY